MIASNTDKIKVLIVEDHSLTRFGLKTAFETLCNASVLEADSGKKAVELTKEKKPDVILMDLGLPDINGIMATKAIKDHDKLSKIIILTSHNNEEEVVEAIKAGANGYCLKDIEPDKLVQITETINQGALWFDPGVAHIVTGMLYDEKHKKQDTEILNHEQKAILTERELDVLRHIVDGFSNAEISEKLCVSIHTVKAHVCNILQKLSVDDRTQAAIKALKDGIV